MNKIFLYQNAGETECLQGDTLPVFHIDIENVSDFSDCKMILEDTSLSGAMILEKNCTPDENGFTVQLTSQETTALSGTYRYHFCLTDSAGLQYRKLAGTLTVNPVAQGV